MSVTTARGTAGPPAGSAAEGGLEGGAGGVGLPGLPPAPPPVARALGPVVLRQPVLGPDGSVHAYAVRVAVVDSRGAEVPAERTEHLVDAELSTLDLSVLAGDRPLLLHATRRLLSGAAPLAEPPRGLVLAVPPALAAVEDAADLLTAARVRGARLALADYRGEPAQDRLLAAPAVAMVTVDLTQTTDGAAQAVALARAAGTTVVAEVADGPDRAREAFALGVDLVQGPLLRPRGGPARTAFSAGELQCLRLMQLLSADDPGPDELARVVAADPALAVRVLHLVNSSAFGLRRTVDSVRHAVVLAGPQQLSALAMAALVGARPATAGALWSTLTRAIACRTLTGDDAGYTVGLLSAVAAQQEIAVDALVEQTGVSPAVAQALRTGDGRYGQALTAVVAHEANDLAAVAGSGLDPYEVAHAVLAAMPEAFVVATALSHAT